MRFFMQFILFGEGWFKSCFIAVHNHRKGSLFIGLLNNTSLRK